MAKSPTRKTSPAKSGKTSSPTPGVRGPTPVLEWIAAGVGLVVLVSVIGFVGSEAFHPDRSPPQITVKQLGVVPTEAGYLVSLRVANRGGSAAAQVVVEGELETAGAAPATSEATFDFIADHSSRDGGLFFETDPRAGKLTLRAKGFAEP